MKTIFENNGGTYESQGDYLLPNLTLRDEKQYLIGVWGMRHKRYLKQNHKVLYCNLLTAGTSYGKTQSRKYDVVGAKDE